MNLQWHWPPLHTDALTITTLDAHAAGEPLRIIIGGLPALEGATMLERRRFMREHYDHVRRALMWEPRGHYNMYGCVLTPPITPEADLGVLFMHNEGYSTMCGHAVIALGRYAVDWLQATLQDFQSCHVLVCAGRVSIRTLADEQQALLFRAIGTTGGKH